MRNETVLRKTTV